MLFANGETVLARKVKQSEIAIESCVASEMSRFLNHPATLINATVPPTGFGGKSDGPNSRILVTERFRQDCQVVFVNQRRSQNQRQLPAAQ